jgi:type II secretory pathway component GspD/PulD (secretin)
MKRAYIIFAIFFVSGALIAPERGVSEEAMAHAAPPGAQNVISADDLDPDKITVNFKDIEIAEAIKLLAEKNKISVVMGSNISGRVTMFLKDIDTMDALEMMLLNSGLAYHKSAGIINVMTQRNYEDMYGESFADKKETRVYHLKYARAAEVAQALNQVKTRIGKVLVDESSNSVIVVDSSLLLPRILKIVNDLDIPPPTVTKVFDLKYATAEDLRDNITEELTENIGKIRIDDRTNKIVVTDLETKMGRISEMITAFDEKTPQVLIEAKIVSVKVTDQLRLGINWQSVLELLNKKLDMSSDFTITATDTFPPGLKLTYGQLNDNEKLAAIVQALKTVGDVNVLSSPRITAINNQEARIMVGKSQPYATNTISQTTGSSVTGTNLTFMDIGVKLYVTPTINKDGFISMKIRPEVSSSSTNYTYGIPATLVPVVETASAETSVTVKDGVTIIIGGLIVDERTKIVNKIPFFGSLPYVGGLFSNTDDKVEKRELVVFLTPHIISGGDDMIEQPKTPPIGYKGFFTSGEKMAFERRPETLMDPTMFMKSDTERVTKENRDKVKLYEKYTDTIQPVSDEEMTAAVDEYNYVVKARISEKLASFKAKLALKGSATVSFAVSRVGKLSGKIEVIESTGKAVSAAAVKLVKSAAPFPAFSGKMDPHDRRFVITITLN